MTAPLGTYSFLPWLRHGLANQIATADFDPSVKVRPRVDVTLTVAGDKIGGGTETLTVTKPVALFGPGDIVGIDRRAIVRTEPRDWITNFEPNYLAGIDFYDEDFLWRYTPAAPDLAKGRLRPWLTLLVLKEGEFTEGRNVGARPLPYVDIGDLGVMPPADELWAWAHVHVNRSLAASDAEFVSGDMDAVIPRLSALLAADADLAYSRLLCPRKLAENTGYHAFVIPTFEAGRRAGLGLDLGDLPATMSAWDPGPRPEGQSFPIYHRWFFRTATTGDFETLVRLLVPKPVDPRVGTRDMDVQFPGSNVRGVDNADLHGILKLGGALQRPTPDPPEPPTVYETWDDPFPRPLQEDLAHLVNLPEQYQRAGDPDPIITPPLYGTWHALMKRVLINADGTPILPADNWVHRLNLDPRFRVAAGFGTRVIQDQQEAFMDAAWEQIGKVLEAQRRVRQGQFGWLVSDVWFDRHLAPTLAVNQQQALLLIAPLNKRIVQDGFTINHALSQARVQPTMTSAALRRVIRPRGRMMKALPFDDERTPSQLIARVNAGEVSAAPPKVTPPGLVTPDKVADAAMPADAPPTVVDWLRRYPSLPLFALVVFVLLLVLLALIPFGVGTLLVGALAAAAFYAYRRLSAWSKAIRAADALREENATVAAVDRLPTVSNFTLSEPGGPPFVPTRGPDSVEATRFKAALKDSFELVAASAEAGAIPVRNALDLNAVAGAAVAAVKPSRTIPARVLAGLHIPPRVTADLSPGFVEPMAYPVIDLPMYEPLKNLSSELFLPNINLIEYNTITLLETNQRFIESYMVGVNHEFARELLWREYPTDQRGSTFRQFWDVRSFFNAANLDDEALKEKLRDIPPLHEWLTTSKLGSHDHREVDGENEQELVLVIRGELLKRYPNAVIYAHRACWQRTGDGTPADMSLEPCLRAGGIDNTKERLLSPLTAAEEAAPPREKVLTPLYEAKIDPDIYFFGFDLTVKDAKGGSGVNPADDPGWFFVLKERPGEPRFGFDTEKQPQLNTWNDLSWPDVQPAAPGSYITIATAPASFPLQTPVGEDQEKAPQFADDQHVAWSKDMSSAELAYILFQAPVLVAVHAREMLPKDKA